MKKNDPVHSVHLQGIIDRAGGQKPLAEVLGVAQQTVSWWLINGVPAERVADLLKVDAKLGGHTKPHQLNKLFELRA